MFKRDYTQEIGVRSPTRTIPWRYAIVILALVVAGLAWFTSAELKAYHRRPRPAHALTFAAARPAHPAVAGKASVKTAGESSRHRVS